MKLIGCIFIDSLGHIKYAYREFHSEKCSVAISNYKLGKINEKTLYYTLLDWKEEYGIDTCWTVKECVRRCNEIKAESVKIFTRIQDFLNELDELQFAYIDKIDSWDEEVDLSIFKEWCNKVNKQYIGEKNNIKFFRYTVDKEK